MLGLKFTQFWAKKIKHIAKNARHFLFLWNIRQFCIPSKNKAAVVTSKKSKVIKLLTKSLAILGMKVKVLQTLQQPISKPS